MSKILVADIGGTKIDFALVDTGATVFAPGHQGQLVSTDYQSCEEVIAACLQGFEGRVDYASLAVAGPVVGQKVNFTNLPWQSGAAALQEEFGFTGVVLVNDLVGLAEGVGILADGDVVAVNPALTTGPGGAVVVAPGTGLGAALILTDGRRSWVQATEAGHQSFCPRTEDEEQLLAFLRKGHSHVSFEMVCSGTGLGNIFSYLQSSGLPVAQELAEQIDAGAELAPLLTRRALAADIDCPISAQVYEMFFDILAEFCGNLALAAMPGAGIYLGGGMLPRLGGLFDHHRFVRRFANRGRMSDLVGAMPVSLISQPQTTLRGAWRLGRRVFYDAT